MTDLRLDRKQYAALAAVASSAGLAALDDDARRVLDHTLRDFRRAGIDRDDAPRDRLRELSDLGVKLSQEIGRNIRDDVRSIRVTPRTSGRAA